MSKCLNFKGMSLNVQIAFHLVESFALLKAMGSAELECQHAWSWGKQCGRRLSLLAVAQHKHNGAACVAVYRFQVNNRGPLYRHSWVLERPSEALTCAEEIR